MPQNITIGCVANYCDHEKIRMIAEADYDYIETSLAALCGATDAGLAAFSRELEKVGIPCLAANCLFPQSHSLRLTGPIINGSFVADYLENAFSRAAKIGIKTAALFDGSSRASADEFKQKTDRFYTDFADLDSWLADIL